MQTTNEDDANALLADIEALPRLDLGELPPVERAAEMMAALVVAERATREASRLLGVPVPEQTEA